MKKPNITKFSEQEVGCYKSIDDLGSKIEKLLTKPKLIDKYIKWSINILNYLIQN